jgi:hypothetical protein
MKKTLAVFLLGAVIAACQEVPTEMLVPDLDPLFAAEFNAPQPAFPVSYEGINPGLYPGNFVASDDDQVCYELSMLGYIDDVTTDMRGFKIDPPMDYDDGNVEVILSGNQRYLAWEATNATVHAFILKGGPSFHVYDYTGGALFSDSWLASPLNNGGRIAEISHYNVCYTPGYEDGDQGCTPGYWRNHADRWEGVSPADDFDATFGVDLFDPDITLGQAIWLGGGGANALARHATAALLNAYGGVPNTDGTTVEYPYTVAEVIQMVQDAVANDTIEATKDLFEAANELGCPLSGTPAVPVS